MFAELQSNICIKSSFVLFHEAANSSLMIIIKQQT